MGEGNIARIVARMEEIVGENTSLHNAISAVRVLERPLNETGEFYRGWDSALEQIQHVFGELEQE